MEFSLSEHEIPTGLPEYRIAVDIAGRLRDGGFSAYIVGGAPRDIFMGTTPKDFDICTSATPDEVTRLFPHSHAVGAAFGVITVVEGDYNFEVATYREERDYMDGRRPETVRYSKTPFEDVSRRDFTVNALLLDPFENKIIDYTGGVEDLHKGILRTIGDPNVRFSEDYLRILRAVRFAVRLDLEIEPSTAAAMKALAHKTSMLSAERVRDELDKIILGKRPSRAFRMMSELGILKVILPEIEAMHGIEQPEKYHPEGDVFEHTMLALDNMAYPSLEIAYSILLHDVGKKDTFSRGDDGVPHFYSHDELGADMAEAILRRLKSSLMLIDTVSTAVRNHMRFACVDKMKQSKWRRMLAAKTFPIELELHRTDCAASHARLDNYVLMLDRMMSFSTEPIVPPPLINGRDLIEIGMRPGPRMGEILKDIADLQLEGLITTKEEALARASRLMKS